MRARTIARQIKILFAAYRKDDYADPEGFIVQLGTILERFPDAVVEEITNPLTGIQRRLKFPPSIAEVVEACEEAVARQEKIARYRAMRPLGYAAIPPPPLANGCRARLFVPEGGPGYAAMVERAHDPHANRFDWKFGDKDGRPGIWVNATWYERGRDQ